MEPLMPYDKLFQKLIKEIFKIARSLDTVNENELHRFRVLCKRLTAFKCWVGDIFNDEIQISGIKKLQKTFKAAGRLREIHIFHGIIEKHTRNGCLPSKKTTCLIEKLEKKYTAQFHSSLEKIRSIDDLPILKITNNIADTDVSMLSHRLINRYLNKISKLESKNKKNDNLHKIRILIKRIVYINEMSLKANLGQIIENDTYVKLIKLQNLLGKWHDYEVFLSFLAASEPKNSILLSAIKSEMNLLTEKLHVDLNEILHGDFSRRKTVK